MALKNGSFHWRPHQLKSYLYTFQRVISIIWLLKIALVIGLALIYGVYRLK